MGTKIVRLPLLLRMRALVPAFSGYADSNTWMATGFLFRRVQGGLPVIEDLMGMLSIIYDARTRLAKKGIEAKSLYLGRADWARLREEIGREFNMFVPAAAPEKVVFGLRVYEVMEESHFKVTD